MLQIFISVVCVGRNNLTFLFYYTRCRRWITLSLYLFFYSILFLSGLLGIYTAWCIMSLGLERLRSPVMEMFININLHKTYSFLFSQGILTQRYIQTLYPKSIPCFWVMDYQNIIQFHVTQNHVFAKNISDIMCTVYGYGCAKIILNHWLKKKQELNQFAFWHNSLLNFFIFATCIRHRGKGA